MSPLKSNLEVEIKLRLADQNDAEVRLATVNASLRRPRLFEANVIYDNSQRELRQSGSVLRLRSVGEDVVWTFKGPAQKGVHKTREELELGLTDFQTADQILRRIGFSPVFRYEKYRTEYNIEADSGMITVDETPIGWFLELEGEPAWIDSTAERMGFRKEDYITDSYGNLYLQFCTNQGLPPSHMTFPAESAGQGK